MIAHQQAGHHDGQRSGNVQQPIRQGKPAGRKRKGDQDLHLIVVHAFEHPVGHPHPMPSPKKHPPEDFAYEKLGNAPEGHAVRPAGKIKQHQENHHGHPVVEKGFARDFGFQAVGHNRRF